MINIDIVYKTVQKIYNKENNGYISPVEFNLLSNQVQNEIFREYFEDKNRDNIKKNRGFSTRGYGNLGFNEEQRINIFLTSTQLIKTNNTFQLPEDLYFIIDDGIITTDLCVVEHIQNNNITWLNKSSCKPTNRYPIYEKNGNILKIYPSTVNEIELRYLRQPSSPKWTYRQLNNGNGDYELFDSSNPDLKHFELHESEFTNIVTRLLGYFGINLRENDIIQISETYKDKNNMKDEQ